MTAKQTPMTMAPWRRLAAALALFALLLAGSVSSILHSMTMAAASAAPANANDVTHASDASHELKTTSIATVVAALAVAAIGVDAAAGHEMTMPHDHSAMASGDTGAPGNCGEGCGLCKDCALCSLFAFGDQPFMACATHYIGYELPAARLPASLTPALPSEPPRV